MGTRKFILEGVSPYSDDTALAIQNFVYGRPARQGEHELRVAYPLYSIILFLPFSLISDFSLARAVWMTVLEVALLFNTYFAIKLARWAPSRWMLVWCFIFSVIWYHAFRPLINGNAVILIGLGITGGLLALRNKSDEMAGVLFAFCSIKPQVILIITIFLYFWSIKQKRFKFIIWHASTITLLILSSLLLISDWPLQNLAEIIRYPGYNPPGTFGSALAALLPGIGQQAGWIMTGILALMLLVEWRMSLRSDVNGVIWCAFLTLAASQWIGIQTDPGIFIVLIPCIILIFAIWEQRWKSIGLILTISSMILLLLGLWALFVFTLEPGYQPQQSPIMFFPLPLFVIVGLYWIRWWAIKPPSLWFDNVAMFDDF